MTPGYASLDVQLRIGREEVRIQASVPEEPISLAEFVPIAQSLADVVVATAAREAIRKGRAISCGPNCGACCRQLVPLAESEVRYLRHILKTLDKDQQARVEARLEVLLLEVRAHGLLEGLRSRDASGSKEARRQLGLRYFRLGLPCPFLEQESCSIHRHRPLACREYLVTSSPKYCACPDAGNVETVELPRRPSTTLYRFEEAHGAAVGWLPLPVALTDTELSNPQAPTPRFPGSLLLERFLRDLANAG